LREAVPGVTRVAYLCCIGGKRDKDWGTVMNPPGKRDAAWEASAHRDVVMVEYQVLDVEEIEEAVAHAARAKVQAVTIDSCAACYLTPVQARLHAALEKHRLPATNYWLNSVANGGLLAYGTEPDLNFRRAGYYVGRILNGARAAELPVERLDDIKLYVNRSAARAIGISLPASILLRADRVFD
jgi:putative ABC transport system substrate-binding protein